MQKVPGVTSVKVSLNDGLTVLELKPENSVSLAGLRQNIRNNGFVTNESQLIVRGSVSMSGDVITLIVGGSNEKLPLKASTTAPSVFAQLRSRLTAGVAVDVTVSGIADTRDPKSMSVAVVKVEAP